jgi:hypothetical protein
MMMIIIIISKICTRKPDEHILCMYRQFEKQNSPNWLNLAPKKTLNFQPGQV